MGSNSVKVVFFFEHHSDGDKTPLGQSIPYTYNCQWAKLGWPINIAILSTWLAGYI
jgi:hypothetical protein